MHGPPVRPRLAFAKPARLARVLRADAEAQDLAGARARGALVECERGGEVSNRAAVGVRLALAACEDGAVVRRGDLQIAVSTAGQSPSLAQIIRKQLEKQFGPGYASWVAELGATRKLILASELDKERKLDLLHSLASREALEAALAEIPELAAKGEGA